MLSAPIVILAALLIASFSEGFQSQLSFQQFRKFIPRFQESTNIHLKSQPHMMLYCKKGIDIYENEEVIADLDDTENDLALETFKELALHSNSVSVQAFMEWEDIKDVMSRGFIDQETLGIIMKELGIKSGFMDFAQFKELVEMVNHVNAALEQNDLDGIDDAEYDDEAEEEGSFFPPDQDEDDDTMKWLEKQLKS